MGMMTGGYGYGAPYYPQSMVYGNQYPLQQQSVGNHMGPGYPAIPLGAQLTTMMDPATGMPMYVLVLPNGQMMPYGMMTSMAPPPQMQQNFAASTVAAGGSAQVDGSGGIETTAQPIASSSDAALSAGSAVRDGTGLTAENVIPVSAAATTTSAYIEGDKLETEGGKLQSDEVEEMTVTENSAASQTKTPEASTAGSKAVSASQIVSTIEPEIAVSAASLVGSSVTTRAPKGNAAGSSGSAAPPGLLSTTTSQRGGGATSATAKASSLATALQSYRSAATRKQFTREQLLELFPKPAPDVCPHELKGLFPSLEHKMRPAQSMSMESLLARFGSLDSTGGGYNRSSSGGGAGNSGYGGRSGGGSSRGGGPVQQQRRGLTLNTAESGEGGDGYELDSADSSGGARERASPVKY